MRCWQPVIASSRVVYSETKYSVDKVSGKYLCNHRPGLGTMVSKMWSSMATWWVYISMRPSPQTFWSISQSHSLSVTVHHKCLSQFWLSVTYIIWLKNKSNQSPNSPSHFFKLISKELWWTLKVRLKYQDVVTDNCNVVTDIVTEIYWHRLWGFHWFWWYTTVMEGSEIRSCTDCLSNLLFLDFCPSHFTLLILRRLFWDHFGDDLRNCTSKLPYIWSYVSIF